MRAIIIAMLLVEAAIFLVAIFTTALKRSDGPRRPIWTSLAVALIVVASSANMIGDRHSGQPGADVLQGGAMVLIGMAIMVVMIAVRQRRALD